MGTWMRDTRELQDTVADIEPDPEDKD